MAKRRKSKPKPKSGRPPEAVRHPERVEALLDLVSKGASVAMACRLTGVSKSTVQNWLKKAEQPRAPKHFMELSARLKKAKSDFVAFHLGNIKRAAETQWQASAWSLERSQPGEFASPAIQLQIRDMDRQVRELLKLVQAGGLGEVDGPAGNSERTDAMTLQAVCYDAEVFKNRQKQGQPFKEGSSRLLRDLETAKSILSQPEYADRVLRSAPPPGGEAPEEFLARARNAVELLGPWEKAAKSAVENIKLPGGGA